MQSCHYSGEHQRKLLWEDSGYEVQRGLLWEESGQELTRGLLWEESQMEDGEWMELQYCRTLPF